MMLCNRIHPRDLARFCQDLQRIAMKLHSGLLLLAALALPLFTPAAKAQVPEKGTDTFHNPLLQTGPDPWVITRDGFYYYMNTTGHNLTIWKTRDITDLAHAEKKIVWTAPATGPYSHDIWAPELHFM